MAETTKTYKRAGTFAPGIGANLDTILNRDVLLTAYSIDERPLNNRGNSDPAEPVADGEQVERRSEKATIVMLTLAVDINKPDKTDLFHAWSDSLAQKIGQVPVSELPLLIKFTKVSTGGGFKVLTFE